MHHRLSAALTDRELRLLRADAEQCVADCDECRLIWHLLDLVQQARDDRDALQRQVDALSGYSKPKTASRRA